MTVEVSVADRAGTPAGLRQVGGRPRLGEYLRRIVRYRDLTREMIRGQLGRRTADDVLGAAWYLLSPVLQSAVYVVVFGILLNTVAGQSNRVLFLTCGVFVFAFTSRGLVSASRSVSANTALVRSVRFPRAVLPITSVGVELALMVPALLVLTVIALITGERPALSWLVVPVVVLLQAGFTLGLGMVLARMVHAVSDVAQILPFVLRLWMYLSGVFYSLSDLSAVSGQPGLVAVLEANPMHAYIELVRDAYLGVPIPALDWVIAASWCAAALVIGLVFFWRAEDRYGR